MAGLISPWNLPVYLLTFKIAPAIAAGNTVVCKPSEMTSVTAWMMAKVLNEAGRKSNISVNSFTPRSDPGKVFSLQYQYRIKKTSNENKLIYQLEDYYFDPRPNS